MDVYVSKMQDLTGRLIGVTRPDVQSTLLYVIPRQWEEGE